MNNQNKAYLYALLAVLFWSTAASAFKITLRYTNYIMLLLFSSFIASISLFIILLFQKKIPLVFKFSKKECLNSAFLGFLNPFLYYLILFKAYSLIPAQQAQPLNFIWPLMIVLLSIPLLKQKIKLRSILAIIISFFGVIVISTQGNFSSLKFSNPYGVFLALFSSIIWALFWIFNLKDKREEIIKLFLSFLFGFVYTFVFIIFTQDFTIPVSACILGAVYIGLFEMGITFIFWLKALKFSRTTAQVNNLIYITPFISLIFINFVVGEKIHLYSIIGITLIISGITVQKYKNI